MTKTVWTLFDKKKSVSWITDTESPLRRLFLAFSHWVLQEQWVGLSPSCPGSIDGSAGLHPPSQQHPGKPPTVRRELTHSRPCQFSLWSEPIIFFLTCCSLSESPILTIYPPAFNSQTPSSGKRKVWQPVSSLLWGRAVGAPFREAGCFSITPLTRDVLCARWCSCVPRTPRWHASATSSHHPQGRASSPISPVTDSPFRRSLSCQVYGGNAPRTCMCIRLKAQAKGRWCELIPKASGWVSV